jgi:hypothetical protein
MVLAGNLPPLTIFTIIPSSTTIHSLKGIAKCSSVWAQLSIIMSPAQPPALKAVLAMTPLASQASPPVLSVSMSYLHRDVVDLSVAVREPKLKLSKMLRRVGGAKYYGKEQVFL